MSYISYHASRHGYAIIHAADILRPANSDRTNPQAFQYKTEPKPGLFESFVSALAGELRTPARHQHGGDQREVAFREQAAALLPAA